MAAVMLQQSFAAALPNGGFPHQPCSNNKHTILQENIEIRHQINDHA